MLKALSRVDASNGAPARLGATSTCFLSCSTTLRADSSIFSRSLFQACAIWVRMEPKPGCPQRFSGGKYVPPKNGLSSGVSQTDMGQPPEPVVDCTKVM